MKKSLNIFIFIIALYAIACSTDSSTEEDMDQTIDSPADEETDDPSGEFMTGADLSYVNQIMDHNGVYKVDGRVENPYKIFRKHGTEIVRLRLWHNPDWVRNKVYEDQTVPLYSGFADVKHSIEISKAEGMAVMLDFHYSDMWADPSQQNVPEAWAAIRDIQVLRDSVYNYTFTTLDKLSQEQLMPEYIQIGNEINCGMMYTNTSDNFPPLNGCEGHWANLGAVINSGIQAVRDAGGYADIGPKIILHVAQPENVEWWFDNITTSGEVSDFDIIGLSYYSAFSDVPLSDINQFITTFRHKYNREVMVVETAYPWTPENADNYTNITGADDLEPNYPATKEGQLAYMVDLTQKVMDGGGTGVIYWEPAWISSDMKDLWGTGSSWENNAFFDFNGELHQGINFMTRDYNF